MSTPSCEDAQRVEIREEVRREFEREHVALANLCRQLKTLVERAARELPRVPAKALLNDLEEETKRWSNEIFVQADPVPLPPKQVVAAQTSPACRLLDRYQQAAMKLAVYPPQEGLLYTMLGLNGEAGEVAELVKRRLRGDLPRPSDEMIARELGDVLWYTAALATELNHSLSDIAKLNLQKLNDRAVRGTITGKGDGR